MKIGTRVRKVRGRDAIGITGRIAEGRPSYFYDCCVQVDVGFYDADGDYCPAGSIGSAHSNQWEPIVTKGHQPAEESLKELLPFLKGVNA